MLDIRKSVFHVGENSNDALFNINIKEDIKFYFVDKNIGNKLKTTTHIHLYNHFDLLRGKKNGGYDIAFNLEEDSTDFDVALKVFLKFVSSDEELYKELLKRISRVKSYAEERAKEA